MNKKILLLITIIVYNFLTFAQTNRLLVIGGGYLNNKLIDASNYFNKYQAKNYSGFTIFADAPAAEFIKKKLFLGGGIRYSERGADIIGSFYENTERDYEHKIFYSSFDIPLFLEYRYSIKRFVYHYNNAILDKIALSAKFGVDISFLTASSFSVYKDNVLIRTGKAINDYSPRINDMIHHIMLSISGEYYFDNHYGINCSLQYNRSNALVNTINHPVFSKSIYYEPLNTKFYERFITINIGGIYRF
ncbi:MAG TPA: hypothetical protein P5250_00705 [Bacteroidales bacterium]|nr:hypothetical protein [Bacteroidales bacterium]